jgi:hypothetical protein
METEKEKKFAFSYYHIFMAVLVFLIVRSCLDGMAVQQIGYSEFKKHLENGDVKTAVVRGEAVKQLIAPMLLSRRLLPNLINIKSIMKVWDPHLY